MSDAALVMDASVLVDVLLVPSRGEQLAELVVGGVVAAPAHIDAEVASALSRLHRNGDLSANQVTARLSSLETMTMQRHPVASLLAQAWLLRENVHILDALYLVLAQNLNTDVITTDGRLSRADPRARLVRWT